MEILPGVCFPDGDIGVGIRLNCQSCQRKIIGKFHPMMSGLPMSCTHCGYQGPLSPEQKKRIQCKIDKLLFQAIGCEALPSVEDSPAD